MFLSVNEMRIHYVKACFHTFYFYVMAYLGSLPLPHVLYMSVNEMCIYISETVVVEQNGRKFGLCGLVFSVYKVFVTVKCSRLV